jgi:hypothetical protein
VESLQKTRFKELNAFDRLEGERGLDTDEKVRKNLVINELEHSLLQEEISWRQKSRILRLKEGDQCTKFFQRVANSNRRSNSIELLLVDGSLSSNQSVIRNHVVHFY